MGVREILGVAKPTDLVLTLNDDTVCPADYIATLVAGHRGRRTILGSVALEAGSSIVLDAGVRVNWWTAKFIRRCRGRTLEECRDALSGLAPVDLLSGRGTLVPAMAYREIGLYAEDALPHYGADYEFTARARRSGWSLEACGQARLQSYSHMTGIDPGITPLSLAGMMRSLVTRRSSNCLWYRWVFAVKTCPRPQLLVFLPLDTLRVLAGTLRRQLKLRFDNHRYSLGR
jgi:GT2 family glycosyltransferase